MEAVTGSVLADLTIGSVIGTLLGISIGNIISFKVTRYFCDKKGRK